MIIDEKWMHPPPPPYLDYRSPPPPFSEVAESSESTPNTSSKPTFSTLPSHLLLHVVYSTFPTCDGRYEGETKIERQRMNLYWLETSLRLVNKSLYIACMHILHETYLGAYASLVRPPYTSDPLSSTAQPGSELIVRRELATLDLFIALLAHEDFLLDATSLHLPREEAYKDLFDMVQPRSRLEDLVLEEGVKAGLVYQGNTPSSLSEPSSELGHSTVTDVSRQTTEAVVSARPEVTGTDVPPTQLAVLHSASPQPSPSPTKVSFNPFSRSSYISLAKSKIRRGSPPSSSPSTSVPASPIGNTTFASSSKVKAKINPLPFEALGVSFSPRRIALIYTPAMTSNGAYNGSTFGALSVSVTGPTAAGGMKAKKTLVEVGRARDEKLEVSAKRLIKGLEEVMSDGGL
ncbi:hypothetical protein BT96DRAFT_176882 [Gymnopus androsaceus JB14]|uniref:Uncharacterized protein n=1 Tax=Gymnopus androsaceus JB14 TaxID=1447944 RepID=A0A6A4I8U7_9AGAR|nr:hypothetical protein BT96DRAFT_176882 [Gymnopus androsaceus JB14]